MRSFPRLIAEIYTAPVPWEWKPDEAARMGDGHFVARFMMGPYRYRVEISPGDEAAGTYEIVFFQEKNFPRDFTSRYDGTPRPYPSFQITGTGRAYEVFSTVVDILKDFIDVEQPLLIDFGADEVSRQKLYARIIQRVPQIVPDYVGIRKSRSKFQIKRKSGTRFGM